MRAANYAATLGVPNADAASEGTASLEDRLDIDDRRAVDRL